MQTRSNTDIDGFTFKVRSTTQMKYEFIEAEQAFIYRQPIEAESVQVDETKKPVLAFKSEFVIEVKLGEQDITRGSETVKGPKIEVSRGKLGATTGLECQGEKDKLCSTKSKVAEKLAGIVVPLTESQFFDLPNPARNLIGFMSFFNNFMSSHANSGKALLREQNLNVGFNCKSEKFEKQFAQNKDKTRHLNVYVDENLSQLSTWQFPGVDIVETLQMPFFKDFTFEGKSIT